MNLQELLEYTAKEYLDDRTDLLDGEPDELWPDKTIVRYLADAERRLCRRAWVLKDEGHPQAGTIVLATGKATYKLHKSVLGVLAATPTDRSSSLPHGQDARILDNPVDASDAFDVNRTSTIEPGRPLVFSTDSATRILRVVPTPTATENGLRVLLKVARMPVCPLTLDNLKAEPEVDEQWHLEVLCKYAAGKCLTHPNVDASAKTEGRNLLAEVEATIREARQERERLEHSEPVPYFASTTALIR